MLEGYSKGTLKAEYRNGSSFYWSSTLHRPLMGMKKVFFRWMMHRIVSTSKPLHNRTAEDEFSVLWLLFVITDGVFRSLDGCCRKQKLLDIRLRCVSSQDLMSSQIHDVWSPNASPVTSCLQWTRERRCPGLRFPITYESSKNRSLKSIHSTVITDKKNLLGCIHTDWFVYNLGGSSYPYRR